MLKHKVVALLIAHAHISQMPRAPHPKPRISETTQHLERRINEDVNARKHSLRAEWREEYRAARK